MKLAYVVIQMPAPSEVFLALEIQGLMRLGNEIEVFSMRSPHSDHDKLVIEQNLQNVDLHFLPIFSFRIATDIAYWLLRKPLVILNLVVILTKTCWRQPMVWLRSLGIVPKSLSIARAIEQEGVDALHIAWGHYPAVTAFLVRRLLPELPVTLALGAYDRVARHPMTVVAADMVDRVITQSEALSDQIRNEWPKTKTPVEVILRGSDISYLKEFRGAAKEPGLIVSSARLEEHKGHQYLIQALPRIIEQVPNARLVIYGSGPYQPELEKLVNQRQLNDRVTFEGHQSHAVLFSTVAKADVFALVSDKDWLPNSVKEAMALGVPVVTTRTSGIEELVLDGSTGYIVPCGDVDAIAQRVAAILTDPALAGRFGDAALAHINKFDLGRTSEQRNRLFHDLVSHKSAMQR